MGVRIPPMRDSPLPIAALAILLIAAAPEATTFELERLNGTYTDLGGDVREVRNGPVVVKPTSSSNSFELIANRLELTPLGEDEHQADLWVHFEGEADVEAEILVGSLSGGTLQDKVIVPNQKRTLRTRIKLERRDEDYLITIVESDDDVDITIQSRLAGQIVSLCESITRFTFGSSCDGLEAALSNPKIPMPEPGKQFVLDSGELSPEEERELADYLARSR